jgi:hypothetical protein
VFRGAFNEILATMELIMAESKRQAAQPGAVTGQSAKDALRARGSGSRGTSSNGLSALQVNSRVFEAMFLNLRLGILLQ